MIVFYFFAAVLIFLGFKSLRGGFAYLAFFKSELNRSPIDYLPFATVFVPCRGLDQNFAENISAIFEQDYGNYEVIFVLEDESDEAAPVLGNFTGLDTIDREGSNITRRVVYAGKAQGEGQKVHNLRIAVGKASDKSEVFVFADSDARPGRNWLRSLIGPLNDNEIGCTTGYRWFISSGNAFFGQLCSVWNASIASALGADRQSNFCWGGSTAMRRDTFERTGIQAKWKGTLSDDFTVTRVLKAAEMPIIFVPECLTATVEETSFRKLLEFTTRQMKITRVYSPNLWIASFLGSGLFTFTFWPGVFLLFFLEGWHLAAASFMLFLIFGLGAAKAWIRLAAVRLVLTDYESELRRSLIWQLTLWPVSTGLFFYNSICALVSNEICWRGIRYKLISDNETAVIENISE